MHDGRSQVYSKCQFILIYLYMYVKIKSMKIELAVKCITALSHGTQVLIQIYKMWFE